MEELEELYQQVKAKATEMKELEAKLKTLNKADKESLDQRLAADECELNGFDGCAAFFFD